MPIHKLLKINVLALNVVEYYTKMGNYFPGWEGLTTDRPRDSIYLSLSRLFTSF